MGLNKQKGNMYGFITHTWNPIGGECPHKCIYCSTHSFYYPHLKKKYSGPPVLIKEELNTNLGRGKFIFVVGQNDLFAEEIHSEWIAEIINHCIGYPDNTYLFQSKNPVGFFEWRFPLNTILCTTIESDIDYPEISKTPSVNERALAMTKLSKAGYKTMVTIEPILDFNPNMLMDYIKSIKPDYLNIGADSKGHKLPEPSPDKLKYFIEQIKELPIQLYIKQNLKRLLK